MEKRILLVEDDASLARSLVGGLLDEGFIVSHAADGNAAREALRSAGGADVRASEVGAHADRFDASALRKRVI